MIGLGIDGHSLLYGFAYWDGEVPDDQFSQMTFASRASNTRVGVAVRVSASGSPDSATLYAAIFDGGIKLVRYVKQSLLDLGTIIGTSDATFLPGDRLTVSVWWKMLCVFINDYPVIGPVFDKSIASGKAGAIWFGNTDLNGLVGGPVKEGTQGELTFVGAQIPIQ